MPPVPVELKKQVKAANDIADVIAGYLPLVPAGKQQKALCPFHNDTRPSLTIDRQYQNFRCWACGAKGDVFDFVMKFEKVEFPEALRLLAQRAGISLTPDVLSPEELARGRMLHLMRWAEEQYRDCLLNDPASESAPKYAEGARRYLGERRISGATGAKFGLGFAPVVGDWLVRRGADARIDSDLMVEVGLIAARDENRGFYDRFRDRVMFPIRDVRGQTVGFGGRILPDSPLAARAPKYYNTADTPLFSKKTVLYGLDLARHAGTAVGYLAVVEGYTDVMMAHQCGVAQVVATMGTALDSGHVSQLRRYAPKVVLVYDADAGGQGGVDRALELFVSQDVDLAVATLPDGLDPCDLLVQPGGPETFQKVLANAVNVLDFKLNHLLATNPGGVDGSRRVIDAILGIMALAPPVPNQAGQVKQELIVSRLHHRLGLRQETVWARLGELKAERRRKEQQARAADDRAAATTPAPRPAARPPKADGGHLLDMTLLRLLLAEPGLVPTAAKDIPEAEVRHTGVRRVVAEMYALWAAGQVPDLDALRVRLIDRPDLVAVLLDQTDIGRMTPDRPAKLASLITDYKKRAEREQQKSLADRLKAGPLDDAETIQVFRELQRKAADPNAA